MKWYDYPISHGFYSEYNSNIFDTPHYAVDIATPVGTPITAIKSGKVRQADYAVWNGQSGGGEVWVKPDDGSPEYYYYHLDQNKVSSGQHVQAGDVVGLSGGQTSGGTHPTSPAWSTGPHLHVGFFTDYVNTPIGMRPKGPDISPTIQQLKTGGIPQVEAKSSFDIKDPLSIKKIYTSVAIFLLGLTFLVLGFIIIFQKPIGKAIKVGAKVATKGVL